MIVEKDVLTANKKPEGFSVVRRNFGHWDIYVSVHGRIFAIRGGPGDYYIRDERPKSLTISGRNPILKFSTVGGCMNYICDILMYELIVVKGQVPAEIEEWNIS